MKTSKNVEKPNKKNSISLDRIEAMHKNLLLQYKYIFTQK